MSEGVSRAQVFIREPDAGIAARREWEHCHSISLC